MNSAFECGICNHAYDEAERKPLALFCGHTYCQQCLQSLESAGSPACPSCRKEFEAQVAELPVIFALISSSNSSVAPPKNLDSPELCCSIHKNELDYWCVECKVLICKQCLIQMHSKHDLTLAEEIFTNEEILAAVKNQVGIDVEWAKASIDALQQLETLATKIDEAKPSFPVLKESLVKYHSCLDNLQTEFTKLSTELLPEQKNIVLQMLKKQTQASLVVSFNDTIKQFQDLVAQCQISNVPELKIDAPTEKYLPDDCYWNITSEELAEKALCTIKETEHFSRKIYVKSTDGSPILCLPKLLQYLAASNSSFELQLMDTAIKKNPFTKEMRPLNAEGNESTDFKHCYRLKVLINTLLYFQNLAAARASFGGDIVNDSSQDKMIVFIYPCTHTYDVCVLSSGKIVKSSAGSWPLPLEIHVFGLRTQVQSEWVEQVLFSLYYTAQPGMRDCRVYLPQYEGLSLEGQISLPLYGPKKFPKVDPKIYPKDAETLFALFAKLGKKFFTHHRVFLPNWSGCDNSLYLSLAVPHKLSVEFKTY